MRGPGWAPWWADGMVPADGGRQVHGQAAGNSSFSLPRRPPRKQGKRRKVSPGLFARGAVDKDKNKDKEIFQRCLEKYFGGEPDRLTLAALPNF